MWIGFELTLYGMGLVFLLLAILWGLISLVTRFDTPSPEPVAGADVRAHRPAGKGRPLSEAALDPSLLAAIVIACRAHRMARRKQAAPEMRTHEPGSLPSRWVGTGRTRQNRSWAPGGRFS
jgi:Na+-transporting methylmalonyl-CoA/oxaloacetate decarboxylase gamma subunit